MMDGYRLSNRRAQILLFLAVCWSLVPILLTSSVSAQTTFGPESVWDIEEIPFGQFTSCAGEDECVLSIMRAYNAPDGAIAFAKALEGEGFMSGFTETGIVDLVEIVYPTRANDNFQYVLINGSPPLVHVEDMWNLDLSQDSLYPSLILDYPGLNLWAGDNKLQSMEDLSDGGQRFIFSYVLKDGCHACETAGETLVALDFDSLGRYLGPRLLELIPTIEQVEDVSVESRAVGGLIAYIGPDGNIWLISPDGSGNLRITEDALENSAAVHFIQYSIRSWSPDGLFLAYGRYELFGIGQEKEQLMIYDTVAGTVKEIIGGGSNTFNDITWDTSGSAIIFGNGITGFELSCHPAEFDDPASLWSIDINTGELAEIVAPERGLPLSSPVMSPDGRYISFVEADQCEGVGLFAVYDTKNNSYIAWNERVGTYGWTLDGQHIIYDGIEYAGRGPGLTRSNPEGTNHQELTSPEEQVSDQSPLVSPTGDRIAFSRGGLDESGYLTSIGLWVMNVDGSGPRMLSGLGITSYSWSSDGQHMAVGMGESRDGATIFIFEVDIGESYKLGEGMWPAWQPATSGIPPISKARPWLEEKASLIEQLEQLDIPTSLFTIPAFEAYNEDGARELYERVKSQSEEGTLTQQQLEAFARLTLGERGLSQILPAYTSTAATISDISIDTITTILATLRILPWDNCAQQVYFCDQIQAMTERTAWRLIRHGGQIAIRASGPDPEAQETMSKFWSLVIRLVEDGLKQGPSLNELILETGAEALATTTLVRWHFLDPTQQLLEKGVASADLGSVVPDRWPITANTGRAALQVENQVNKALSLDALAVTRHREFEQGVNILELAEDISDLATLTPAAFFGKAAGLGIRLEHIALNAWQGLWNIQNLRCIRYHGLWATEVSFNADQLIAECHTESEAVLPSPEEMMLITHRPGPIIGAQDSILQDEAAEYRAAVHSIITAAQNGDTVAIEGAFEQFSQGEDSLSNALDEVVSIVLAKEALSQADLNLLEQQTALEINNFTLYLAVAETLMARETGEQPQSDLTQLAQAALNTLDKVELAVANNDLRPPADQPLLVIQKVETEYIGDGILQQHVAVLNIGGGTANSVKLFLSAGSERVGSPVIEENILPGEEAQAIFNMVATDTSSFMVQVWVQDVLVDAYWGGIPLNDTGSTGQVTAESETSSSLEGVETSEPVGSTAHSKLTGPLLVIFASIFAVVCVGGLAIVSVLLLFLRSRRK